MNRLHSRNPMAGCSVLDVGLARSEASTKNLAITAGQSPPSTCPSQR